MPKQILHILGTAGEEGTGVARIVAGLARGLDRERYCLHAWFLGGKGPLVDVLKSAGVCVRQLDWQRGARDPAGGYRFWQALKSSRFAIVHQHFGGRSVRWLVRRAAQTPLIVHVHGCISEPNGTVHRLDLSGADEVVANSRALAAQVNGARARVVYPGVVDLGTEGGDEFRDPGFSLIGCAARLVAVKGIIHLLPAMRLLRSEIPRVRLEIAGSGPEQAVLQSEARQLGLESCVSFLGWRAALRGLMNRWEVFVLPSLQEGFGMAAVEAMAAGLPVVASAVGGLPEIVEDGQTGYLVPPRDPVLLAARLRTLLLDPGLRSAMSTAARARARQQFSLPKMAHAITEIYDRLLGLSRRD